MPKKAKLISKAEKLERQAINIESKHLKQREGLELLKPLYVSSEHFRVILESLNSLKGSLKENNDSIGRLSDLEKNKEKYFDVFAKQVEAVQRKLIFADKTLFKGW